MVKPNHKEAFVEPDILRIAEKLTPQQLAAVVLNWKTQVIGYGGK